ALAASGVTFTLPPAAVKALAAQEAAQVEVAAARLAPEEAKRLVAGAANAPSPRLIGDVFELNAATVARDGTRQAVERFGAAIRVSLPVPEEAREAAAAGRLDAHRYDEAANAWQAMGGSYDAQARAITFETDHLSKYAVLEKVAPPVRTFADIQGHWAQKDIEVMAGLGITGGVAPDRFGPNRLVTRAQFAAFLIRSLGITETRPTAGQFKDVNPDAWYYGVVETARAAGLVGGYPDGTFRPQANITREEIASMLHRGLAYAGKRVTVAGEVEAILAPFADAREVGPWARESVAAAVKERILRGRTPTSLVPKGNATRAEAVVMLKRLLVSLGRIAG
ncbi:MAG: S-layer homology domain-containing protein, partial [Clostridia bacterium]|nr:S-layer homology domain-containing protein [Clostridia bacterium]